VDWSSDSLTEMIVSELDSVVDLFILDRKPIFNFNRGKILVVDKNKFNWPNIKTQLSDLRWVSFYLMTTVLKFYLNFRYDDLVLSVTDSEIPNPKALLFLKFYNGWPYEPITFRMRWSVFGYFWLHPQLTALAGRACTVGTLERNFGNNIQSMR
jgi:hypothetical protein